jgi:hypothetical protein
VCDRGGHGTYQFTIEGRRDCAQYSTT